MRIKELREAREMTQKQLAKEMGVLQNTVSQWESEVAFPRMKQLPILANVFAVEIGDLFVHAPPTGEIAS